MADLSISTRHCLPATTALNKFVECCRSSHQKRFKIAAPPTPPIACNNMLDTVEFIDVSEPIEESTAFPKIEWASEDDESCSRDHVQDYLANDPSGMLGKRARQGNQNRLVRSKKIKSSLCYLAEQSINLSYLVGGGGGNEIESSSGNYRKQLGDTNLYTALASLLTTDTRIHASFSDIDLLVFQTSVKTSKLE